MAKKLQLPKEDRVPQYPAGEQCEGDECTTILSFYTKTPYCNVCQDKAQMANWRTVQGSLLTFRMRRRVRGEALQK